MNQTPFKSKRPLASISVDLDNQWSYMKTYGRNGWEKFPSYLDTFVPYVTDIFAKLQLKATFFVVGKDMVIAENRDAFKLIIQKGHEVGNHSFNHEPWLNSYPIDKVKREIFDTEEQIIHLSGQKPVGFRGPGFSLSNDVLEVLSQGGYLYDSTTLPTFLGPLARAYYFRNQALNKEERNKRKDILGGFNKGTMPVKPFRWKLPSGNELLEIPVTTIPFIKVPFHMSYLMVLAIKSELIMRWYLKLALFMCRVSNTVPSFIVHPTDLIGCDQISALDFFPGMNISSDVKLNFFLSVINEFLKYYDIVGLYAYAESILKFHKTRVLPLKYECR